MKKVIKILAVLLIFCAAGSVGFSMSRAQKEKILSQIREDYKKTNENVKKYKVRTVEVKKAHKTTFLNPGDSVRFYTENGTLRKIITFTYDEGEKTVTEYYIKNGMPYFVAETVTEINGKKIEPAMMTRYYFGSGGIIRVTYDGEINEEHELAEVGADVMQTYYEVKNIK